MIGFLLFYHVRYPFVFNFLALLLHLIFCTIVLLEYKELGWFVRTNFDTHVVVDRFVISYSVERDVGTLYRTV
jgi:hypothetical protein